MIAETPNRAASSTLSRNGKKASEATAELTSGKLKRSARIAAILTESTRFICPAPTPIVLFSSAKTIAFDLTCLQTFQARSIERISASVVVFGDTFSNRFRRLCIRLLMDEKSAGDLFVFKGGFGCGFTIRKTRNFLCFDISNASRRIRARRRLR